MPRDVPVGNGSLLVAFDKKGLLREFYFPHVGQENHTKGEPFKIGVWVGGEFSWVGDDWTVTCNYVGDALVTDVVLTHPKLQLKITMHDCVDFHENIYLKQITLENLSTEKKEVRLFLGQDFHIMGNDIGDTAVYKPDLNALLHYKEERYFLINIRAHNKTGIDHYATGNKEVAGFEGTWKDAEDGVLSGNPIAQGSVDSIIGIHFMLLPKVQESCFYWIVAGKRWKEVKELNEVVQKKTPEQMFKRTLNYWKLWIHSRLVNTELLPEKVVHLYKRSLLICRTQIDTGGAILAGNDSDVVYFNRDTYSYMWPRDAALIAYGLNLAGYYNVTCAFFNFCRDIIGKEGYFLHKYTPTGSFASSWHPWIKEQKPQLPIQEDETALIIWSLWHHYRTYDDVEFIKPLYRPLIKRAADFMMNYRDENTGLPLPSYDLWEERQGVLTFTVAAVHGGLTAAANFMEIFGDLELAAEYRKGADGIRQGMDKYLYLENEKRFARMVKFKEDKIEVDSTIDASLYGIFAFGAYKPDDLKVESTMQQIYDKLWCKTEVGGLCRYENDGYYRQGNQSNPWFVTTLWLAQYYIAKAQNRNDLAPALKLLEWVCDHALPSGVLAEQINPFTHEPMSISPLTWSHGTYIIAVHEYLNKLVELEECEHCGHSKNSKYL